MDSTRITPDCVEQYRSAYPEAAAYLDQHGNYLPDALKDTTRGRNSAAQSLLEWMERLKAVSGCDTLVMGTLDLRELDHLPLYSKRTIARAQKIVDAHFRRQDVNEYIWKLERGRDGGTHVHAVIAADANLMDFVHYKVVENDLETARYLCKPADARACGRRPKDLSTWTPQQFDEQRMAAINDFVTRPVGGGERMRFRHHHGLGRRS
ncbi:hypothetical protein LAJ19_13410 [Deinococcus taeanensis]|uniref:hypothetical protein n=1 Tax=Deinococcus taeanensis TaxID=2737050 RepID=UPI001CDC2F57|nr:hypothetical protein [Deinococcus taeanensis]UBV42604.1 hypothetical protein LAJ19_13410 [Deinococcus taeanensis]